MKTWVPFLILVILSGCVTQKKCLSKFPPVSTSDTIVIESLRDTIIYRDSLIVFKIPGDTIIDTLEIHISGEPVHSDTLILDTEYARAEAFYKTPSIHLFLIQKDIYFEQRLDSVIRLETFWKEKYTTITNTDQIIVKEKYIPAIYKVALWMWIGIIIGAVLILIVRVILRR
jgi:hypothetical protein